MVVRGTVGRCLAMNTSPQLSEQEITELVDRTVPRHPWAGLGPSLVLWLLIAALGTGMFLWLGQTAAIVVLVLSIGFVYLRASRVSHRNFQRNILWEQIYRAPHLQVCTFEFASWYYAEDHALEYLFAVEARDGRWFHVVSEDVYYFVRDGVPSHWAVRVYPKTRQVVDVTGTGSLGLIEPRRINLSDGKNLHEFGEYRSFEAVPPNLRASVDAARTGRDDVPA